MDIVTPSRPPSLSPSTQVTILFMDIVGFTSMSQEVEPVLVMTFLNQ